ncbi:MAG: hypothetical protein HY581_05780 [Nitrospirae bacterium]|nr:hypothetical protein [Nitrospirota bacterium]
MRCLDHIDMAVMTGGVTVVASAIFFFAYLGVEREPLAAPAPITSAAFLQSELGKAINEAVVTPARVTEERERTQVTLGEAIMQLTQVQVKKAAFVPELTASAAAAKETRRGYLEEVFKLPADWKGPEFTARERQADAMAQPELGRMIVAGSLGLMRRLEATEADYGRALLAATLAVEREAIEPTASQGTIMAAAAAAKSLGERTALAPAPEVTREAGWGFGSIGDGAFIPIMVLGAGALLLWAAGAGMMERGVSTRALATHCDVHEKDVVVEMLVSDDMPYEVTRCSAFNGGPVTCDKHCLKWPMARAA